MCEGEGDPTHHLRGAAELCDNGLHEFCCYVEKFDTAASMNMSGNPTRLQVSTVASGDGVAINGFNGSRSYVTTVGLNGDKKKEYFVRDMPKELVLLCAQMYASDGAAILFKDGGVVLSLDEDELAALKRHVADYKVLKRLKVVNRTYEVDNKQAEAMSSMSNRYFNTKVNVSNGTQRVMTMLLTGLSFQDLYLNVKHGSVRGLPPDLTTKALNHFEHKYGRTPDIVRMANPLNLKSRFGLMTAVEVTVVGQRCEMDVMNPDYNEVVNGKTKKLKTHGGANAAAVVVDCYSEFVMGKLLKKLGNSKVYVSEFISLYELAKIKMVLLAADSGVNSQSMFEVFTTEVEQLLIDHGIRSERAEPHNHARGTPVVERTIRSIKELMRLAIVYVFSNPNFKSFGFTRVNILKLWGELFNWSIAVINFKPCPNNKTITRYEAFYGKQPNFQNIRMLPIFSVFNVYRKDNNNVITESLSSGEVVSCSTNKPEFKLALYVGPSMRVPGAIRAAYMTGSQVKVVPTSKFTAATDGGGFNIHEQVEKGTKALLELEQTQGGEESQPQQAVDSNINGDELASESSDQEECDGEGVVDPFSEQVIVPNHEKEKKAAAVKANNNKKKAKKKQLQRKSNTGEASGNKSDAGSNPYDRVYSSGGNRRTERSSKDLSGVAHSGEEVLESACLADVTDIEEEKYYWSWIHLSFMCISSDNSSGKFDNVEPSEEGFRAVTVGVPRDFNAALHHPKWGKPAQKELYTVVEATGALCNIDREVALDCIRNHGADLVILFPVYEEKIRDGERVYKVRLVGDGRTHNHPGNTYAATPSREELLILLHVIAGLGWHYALVDEIRAFLNAKYKGKNRVFAKLKGDQKFFEVKGALYGLKTSPKDYQDEVVARLLKLGYTRLVMCSCMYVLVKDGNIVVIYDFVDDFVFAGNNKAFLVEKINEWRDVTATTEPVFDPPDVLGMELTRDYERKVICVRMTGKIDEAYKKFVGTYNRKVSIPMPTAGYIIKDEQYEQLPEEKRQILGKKGIHEYMSVIGCLIWITGVRMEILFTVMYLSWSTKVPRQHHLDMAKYCVVYLYQSRDLPLVLGGDSELKITAYTDASLGTATKGRSVIGHMVKLNERGGAIFAKSTATQGVHLSSFEAELDGTSAALKSISRVENILTELRMLFADVSVLYGDNEAMIKFVRGEGVAKGVRHMELRMWFIREKYQEGRVDLQHMQGVRLPADKLTKLGNRSSHAEFTGQVLGLQMLSDEYPEAVNDDAKDIEVNDFDGMYGAEEDAGSI